MLVPRARLWGYWSNHAVDAHVREDRSMTDANPPDVRRQLGDFLRARRERLSPEDVGLPATARRRTPGLRREEVAVLAGVGVTWYTWLEQGRPINVSLQVLMAVGRTLQLDAGETRHLQRLAGMRVSPTEPGACDPDLAAAFLPVLEKLDPYPACLQTPWFDVVVYNRSYRFLFTDLDRVPPGERNCAVQFFTDPDWRSRYVDDDIFATRMVARMRASVGADLHGAAASTVGDLRDRSDEFAQLWGAHDILVQDYETKRLNSPLVGILHLNFVSTEVAATGHRMTVMTPADDGTSEKLAELGSRTSSD